MKVPYNSMHVKKTDFKQLVSCTMNIQLHETFALIPDTRNTKHIRVSSNENFLFDIRQHFAFLISGIKCQLHATISHRMKLIY